MKLPRLFTFTLFVSKYERPKCVKTSKSAKETLNCNGKKQEVQRAQNGDG